MILIRTCVDMNAALLQVRPVSKSKPLGIVALPGKCSLRCCECIIIIVVIIFIIFNALGSKGSVSQSVLRIIGCGS